MNDFKAVKKAFEVNPLDEISEVFQAPKKKGRMIRDQLSVLSI